MLAPSGRSGLTLLLLLLLLRTNLPLLVGAGLPRLVRSGLRRLLVVTRLPLLLVGTGLIVTLVMRIRPALHGRSVVQESPPRLALTSPAVIDKSSGYVARRDSRPAEASAAARPA